ncbi:hypothetical protein TRIUR3_11189 [Triticum urartu]|uniref:Uncharacterized protein n=2 Tax=Triticum TaxID=4564 RepID=A0A9R0QBD9_TRITD|nr:hypothetical protein TRIUR3_11189 [Triticum urartu]VAH08253.1 unnamed protein product [Triticum turgidum subsp. durum]
MRPIQLDRAALVVPHVNSRQLAVPRVVHVFHETHPPPSLLLSFLLGLVLSYDFLFSPFPSTSGSHPAEELHSGRSHHVTGHGSREHVLERNIATGRVSATSADGVAASARGVVARRPAASVQPPPGMRQQGRRRLQRLPALPAMRRGRSATAGSAATQCSVHGCRRCDVALVGNYQCYDPSPTGGVCQAGEVVRDAVFQHHRSSDGVAAATTQLQQCRRPLHCSSGGVAASASQLQRYRTSSLGSGAAAALQLRRHQRTAGQ